MDKRVLVVAGLSEKKSHLYKIPITDQPCSDLCATCHEVKRKQCVTCQPNSSVGSGSICSCDWRYFEAKLSFSRKQCLECSALCGTCSGPAATQCLSCRDPNMELLGDGSCRCKEGFYLSGSTCLACDPSCISCNGGGRTGCLSCSQGGYFLKGSTCVSCPVEIFSDCPEETQIKALTEIQNSVQNMTIEFSPSLKVQLREPAQAGLLNSENLLKNHLRITFGDNETTQTPLVILKSKLTHTETTGSSSSYLFIEYLQKIKSLNSSGYIKVAVTNPWIYHPQAREEHPKRGLFQAGIQHGSKSHR